MLNNPKVVDPNDFKVVRFTNRADFTFTPDMGCMYDGRPIFGGTGAPGINAGESMMLPYHVAHRLAVNLAKVVKMRMAPTIDPQGVPTGIPLWDDKHLNDLKLSYLTDMYSEERPVAMTEVDRLMQKVEEYRKLTETVLANQAAGIAPVAPTAPAAPVAGPAIPAVDPIAPVVNVAPSVPTNSNPVGFQDKADVIAELEKRGIKHDKRKSKADLEKLLVPVVA